MTSKVNKSNFWEERYTANNTPWDIGEPAPAFVKYFCRGLPWQASVLKIAVLGCGLGHDAFYLAKNFEDKFEVSGFDFSKSAIKFCNEIKGGNNIKNIYFHHADFFTLVEGGKWKNYFDLVIEHTSFCAIDPSRRKKYVDLIKYLLKPKGELVGLFFIRPIKLGGPPFGSTEEEIRKLFKNDFLEIEKLRHESCPHTFTGDEYFGVFEKTIQ